MHRDEIIKLMQDPVAQELLNAPIHARLAYTGKDGSPRVIPIGYFWNGDAIVMVSPVNSPKIRALSINPKVAITIDRSTFPPHVLLIRGEAAIEIVDGVPAEFIESSRRFVGAENMPEWETGVRALYKQMAILSIIPTWAKIFDFETRLPSPVTELINQATA